ncbi:MAG: hypothetical protein QM793_06255 [Muricomes sp.]
MYKSADFGMIKVEIIVKKTSQNKGVFIEKNGGLWYNKYIILKGAFEHAKEKKGKRETAREKGNRV